MITNGDIDANKSGSEFDSLLREVYYDPANPGSFSSAWSLYRAAKPLAKKLKLRDVQRWLAGQRVHQLHVPARKHFPRRHFRVRLVDEQWQADIGYVVPLARQNGGTKYLLYVIDVLSRYLWLEPMRDKTGESCSAAFQAILKRAAPRKPDTLFTDNGSEFRAEQFRYLCVQRDIKQYMSTHVATKAAIAERVIRTFMTTLTKYMKAYGKRFVEALPKLVDRYNHAYHRSIRMRPVDVQTDNPASVAGAWKSLYANNLVLDALVSSKKYKYPIGAVVRVAISRVKTAFYKGYAQSWSDQLYTVERHVRNEDVPAYRIRDQLTGAEIDRFFYEQELQRVYSDPDQSVPAPPPPPIVEPEPLSETTTIIPPPPSPSNETEKEQLPETKLPTKITRSGKAY